MEDHLLSTLMEKHGLKREVLKHSTGRGLDNRNPVLAEDRDDCIPHSGEIRILAAEMRIDLVHHHVLTFRLCHSQSLSQLRLATAYNILPRGSSFRHI